MNNFSNNAGLVAFMKTKDNTVTSTQNMTMTMNSSNVKTFLKKRQGNETSIIKVTPSNYDEEQIRNLLANS